MKNKISIIDTNMGEPRVVFKLDNKSDVEWVELMLRHAVIAEFGLTFTKDGISELPAYYCILETGHNDIILNEFVYTAESLVHRFAMDTETDIMSEYTDVSCVDANLLQFINALKTYISKTENGGVQ